jgi:hypothetical protein
VSSDVRDRLSLISELKCTGPVHQPVTRTIGTLPDEALLEIFTFYVEETDSAYQTYGENGLETWCTLVHVCQRWREIVFASPRQLNLRLVCTSTRPVMKMLDVWPTLPIVVMDRKLGSHQRPPAGMEDVDNTINCCSRASQ